MRRMEGYLTQTYGSNASRAQRITLSEPASNEKLHSWESVVQHNSGGCRELSNGETSLQEDRQQWVLSTDIIKSTLGCLQRADRTMEKTPLM